MKNMVINVCNKILIVEKEFSCNFMFVYSNQRENHENVYQLDFIYQQTKKKEKKKISSLTYPKIFQITRSFFILGYKVYNLKSEDD